MASLASTFPSLFISPRFLSGSTGLVSVVVVPCSPVEEAAVVCDVEAVVPVPVAEAIVPELVAEVAVPLVVEAVVSVPVALVVVAIV